MMLRSIRRRVLVAVLPFCLACGSSIRTAGPAVQPAAPPVRPVAPQPASAAVRPESRDPVLTLLAEADTHFKAGQEHLDLGHVERARREFDQAVNVLVE